VCSARASDLCAESFQVSPGGVEQSREGSVEQSKWAAGGASWQAGTGAALREPASLRQAGRRGAVSGLREKRLSRVRGQAGGVGSSFGRAVTGSRLRHRLPCVAEIATRVFTIGRAGARPLSFGEAGRFEQLISAPGFRCRALGLPRAAPKLYALPLDQRGVEDRMHERSAGC